MLEVFVPVVRVRCYMSVDGHVMKVRARPPSLSCRRRRGCVTVPVVVHALLLLQVAEMTEQRIQGIHNGTSVVLGALYEDRFDASSFPTAEDYLFLVCAAACLCDHAPWRVSAALLLSQRR